MGRARRDRRVHRSLRPNTRTASQTITAPFTLVDAAGVRTVEGQFPLRRLQFKIGEGAWSDTETVADEVIVRFKFVIPTP